MKARYLSSLLLAALATNIFAMENATKSETTCPSFSELDKNSDQMINREEGFKDENVAKLWDKLDKNLDGNLDKNEFSALMPEEKREEALETDHPVKVQQYENGKYISPEQQIQRNEAEPAKKGL
jgi:hypothetical protein